MKHLNIVYDIHVNGEYGGHIDIAFYWPLRPGDELRVITAEMVPYGALQRAAGANLSLNAPVHITELMSSDPLAQARHMADGLINDLMNGAAVKVNLTISRERYMQNVGIDGSEYYFLVTKDYKYNGGYKQVIAPDGYISNHGLEDSILSAKNAYKERAL